MIDWYKTPVFKAFITAEIGNKKTIGGDEEQGFIGTVCQRENYS